MTEADALTALQAAFPDADEVKTDVTDAGFAVGVGVRFGDRRHAVRLNDWADIDQGISALRKWSGRY